MPPDIDPRRWDEVQGVFHELIGLDLTDRATRLAALGTTDPALRQAVESLLAADADAEAQLASLEATFSSAAAPTPDPLSLAGRTVSHFRVLEPLGAGGMGVVYRAEDTRLGRAVALKFLLPQYSLDAAAKERFLREAHSAAALDHPNLCTIYEVGESEDGRLFLAMALYSGETLKARLAREGPLPVEDVLAIARQIVEGLACAHAAGIVHRDLKPGNVMLVPDGTVKILDFGLAKARDQSLSGPSARLGTVAYMAPEQIRGDAVDARADLWALGVVLYEMLTGRKPFAAEHDAATAHAVVYDEPTRLSTIRADVPAAAEELILTLLEKDPDSRYATAQDLLRTLADIPSFQRPGIGLRWRHTVRRRRGLIIGATATLVVMTAVWVALLVGRSRHRNAAPTPVVVMPFENRSTDHDLDALGAMVADWVAQGLTEAGFLTVLDSRSALAAAHALGSAAAPVAVGRETGAGVVVTGSYFFQSDSLQFQAQIASTADGRILFGIGDVTAPRDRPLDAVERLRQRVLTALASLHDKEVTAFQNTLTHLPTYAAYREYTEGLELYVREDLEAVRHFERAAALDTSFLVARLWAVQGWMGPRPGNLIAIDSLLAGLEPLRHRLGPFYRAQLDFVAAQRARNFRDAYRAALRMVENAPGSINARREAALSALRVLRPREALTGLGELDPQRGLIRQWPEYWSPVAWSHHMLGEYQRELVAARRGRALNPPSSHFRFLELRALAALGRTLELDSLMRAELFAIPGQSGILARAIVGELLAHGHPEAAQRLAQFAAELVAGQPPSEQTAQEWLQQRAALGVFTGESEVLDYFSLERAGARSSFERARDEWLHERAELALLLGDVDAAGNLAAQLGEPEVHGLLLARVAAAQRRHEAARAALKRAEHRHLDRWGSLRGLELDRASALVRMGDVESALAVLTEGLTRGLIWDSVWGNDGHARPDLAPLWPDPRFRALIKPRG